MTRRNLRENVFRILFRLEFNADEDMKEQIEMALDDEMPADEEEQFVKLSYSEQDKKFITDRVLDIVSKHKEIDTVIEGISEGWKINRIGKSELAILRLAIYEMNYDDDVPVKVAINEAVELAKLYCDTDAKSFINALLAKLAR